jgi:hypothetical protein
MNINEFSEISNCVSAVMSLQPDDHIIPATERYELMEPLTDKIFIVKGFGNDTPFVLTLYPDVIRSETLGGPPVTTRTNQDLTDPQSVRKIASLCALSGVDGFPRLYEFGCMPKPSNWGGGFLSIGYSTTGGKTTHTFYTISSFIGKQSLMDFNIQSLTLNEVYEMSAKLLKILDEANQRLAFNSFQHFELDPRKIFIQFPELVTVSDFDVIRGDIFKAALSLPPSKEEEDLTSLPHVYTFASNYMSILELKQTFQEKVPNHYQSLHLIVKTLLIAIGKGQHYEDLIVNLHNLQPLPKRTKPTPTSSNVNPLSYFLNKSVFQDILPEKVIAYVSRKPTVHYQCVVEILPIDLTFKTTGRLHSETDMRLIAGDETDLVLLHPTVIATNVTFIKFWPTITISVNPPIKIVLPTSLVIYFVGLVVNLNSGSEITVTTRFHVGEKGTILADRAKILSQYFTETLGLPLFFEEAVSRQEGLYVMTYQMPLEGDLKPCIESLQREDLESMQRECENFSKGLASMLTETLRFFVMNFLDLYNFISRFSLQVSGHEVVIHQMVKNYKKAQQMLEVLHPDEKVRFTTPETVFDGLQREIKNNNSPINVSLVLDVIKTYAKDSQVTSF